MSENRKNSVYKNKTVIDIDSIVKDIARQWWVILVIALSFALLAGAWKKFTYTPQYVSSTTFAVGKTGFNSALAYDNLNSAKEVTTRFSQVANSSILKKRVCQELGMASFAATVSVNVVESSNLMTMTVTANSPGDAYRIIKSVMKNTKELTSELMNTVAIKTLSEPKIPMAPSQPLYTKGAMKKSALLGAMGMIFLFGILSYFKDTVKNAEEAGRKIDAKLIGTLCHEKKYITRAERKNGKKTSLNIDNPARSFAYVEAVKMMATKVRIAMERKGAKILLVTSVSENEGKSTVAANLALALKQEEKSVLLMDCDFRKPSQYKIFEVNPERFSEIDFADALLGKIPYKIEKTGVAKKIFALFSVKPHQKLLDNEVADRLKTLLSALLKKVDYIIVDTSPMAMAADGEALAEMADATLLVVQQDHMEAKYINDTIDQLNRTKAKVLGFVFNNVHTSIVKKTKEYGRYGYGKYKYGKYMHVSHSEKNDDKGGK